MDDIRKWLENYWYHYKVETLIGIGVIIFLIVGIKGCFFDKKPDLLVTYIGQSGVDYGELEKYRQEISDVVGDINNDGKSYVEISPNVFSTDLSSPRDTAEIQAAATKMIVGASRLFLIEKNLLKFYTDRGLFIPLDGIVSQDVEGAVYEDGKMVLVPLAGSENVKKLGLVPDNLYAGIRVITVYEENNKEVLHQNQGAISLLQYLLDGVK